MTDDEPALPIVDGYYLDREDWPWQVRGDHMRALGSPGEGFDLAEPQDRQDLLEFGPFNRLIAFTADELEELHDVAGQILAALRLSNVARERWGTNQPDLTRDLIVADTWRSIVEKTGDS